MIGDKSVKLLWVLIVVVVLIAVLINVVNKEDDTIPIKGVASSLFNANLKIYALSNKIESDGGVVTKADAGDLLAKTKYNYAKLKIIASVIFAILVILTIALIIHELIAGRLLAIGITLLVLIAFNFIDFASAAPSAMATTEKINPVSGFVKFKQVSPLLKMPVYQNQALNQTNTTEIDISI